LGSLVGEFKVYIESKKEERKKEREIYYYIYDVRLESLRLEE